MIIGKDLRYENGQIITDHTKRAKTDQSLKGIKSLMEKDSAKALCIADEIIKNTYRTLMTRGQKGCYIFCEDAGLRDYLRKRLPGSRETGVQYSGNNSVAIARVAEIPGMK